METRAPCSSGDKGIRYSATQRRQGEANDQAILIYSNSLQAQLNFF
jgi:hypothetical protein